MKPYSKVISTLCRTFQRFANPRAQLASLTLVAVLQKAPAVMRSFNAVKYSIEPATRILQRIAITAASLGTVHAVSGATSAVYSTTNNPNLAVNVLPLTVNQGDSVLIAFSVSNTKNLPQSWSVSGNLPLGLVVSGTEVGPANSKGIFNDRLGSISGIPIQTGTFTFFLKPWHRADAKGDTAEPLEVKMTVVSSNITPVVIFPIADKNIEEKQSLSLDISGNFTDANAGDTLTYSATLDNNTALPSWLSFDTATGIFSGTPATRDIATLAISITASDSELSISDTFTLQVFEERILLKAKVEVTKFGGKFKFSWPTELAHNYQLETSSDTTQWIIDDRSVTEALGFQSVIFTKDEVAQNLFIQVGATLEPLQ